MNDLFYSLLNIFDKTFDKYKTFIQIILLFSFITPIQLVYRVINQIDNQNFFDFTALMICIILFFIGLSFLRQRLFIGFIGNTLALIQWIVIFLYHTF